MPFRSWVIPFLAMVLGTGALAQSSVTDPAPYRHPLLLVTPGKASGEPAEQAYDVEIRIDHRGEVTEILSLRPESAAFRRNLDKVLPLWRFMPKVEADTCESVESTGLVRIEFEPGAKGRSRVFVTYRPLDSVLGRPAPKVVKRSPVPDYPIGAVRGGVQGEFFVMSQVNADGTVGRVVELATSFPGRNDRGLWEGATEAARQVRYEPSDVTLRCALTRYSYKLVD